MVASFKVKGHFIKEVLMANVGVPREVKDGECRVGLSPEYAGKLIRAGAQVFVEKGAGEKAGFKDKEYRQQGARVYHGVFELYQYMSHVIVKVKELQVSELSLMRPYQRLAGFFHLPANPELAQFIKEKHLRILPYEDQVDELGRRPILAAMSKIAGREGAQRGFDYLVERRGEKKVVPSCVQALVIGRGNVGKAAAAQLKENGVLSKNIYILDANAQYVDLHSEFTEGLNTEENLKRAIAVADIVIGAAAALHKGAPKIITAEMIKTMPRRSVFVDVSNDEGGISETSRPTSHSHPTYEEFGVLHYCVPNIPGGSAVAREATEALSAAAYPYLLAFVRSVDKK